MTRLMRYMNKITRCQSMYRTNKSTVDLPGIYHSYVFGICRNPGLSQEKIAKNLCANKSSVARHMAYLETNGYIERKVSPDDKRELLVFPTQKMLDILPEVRAITKEFTELLMQNLTDEELEQFTEILEKLVKESAKIAYGEECEE